MLKRMTKKERERAARPKMAGVYLRDGNRWLVFVTLPDGKKVSKRVPVTDEDSNADFVRKVEQTKAELIAEHTQSTQSKGMDELMDDYVIARSLSANSVKVLHYALEGFTVDDEAKNRRLVDELMASDRSAGTKSTRLKCIRSFYRWAELPDPTAKRKIPSGKPRTRVPTDTELQLLLDVVDHRKKPIDMLYLRLMLATGARCGTIDVIRPCDMLDWKLRLFNVKCSKRYDVRIPITDGLTRELWQQVTENAQQDTPIFDKNAQERLKSTMKRLFAPDADGERLSPHSLRHWKATQLMRDGVSPAVAAKILGHSSPVITLAVYTTVSQDDVDKAFG